MLARVTDYCGVGPMSLLVTPRVGRLGWVGQNGAVVGGQRRLKPRSDPLHIFAAVGVAVCDTGAVARRRLLTAVVAVVLGVAIAASVLVSSHASHPVTSVLFSLIVGWAFVGAGLVAWRRRPDSRVGVLMCAVGLSWLLRLLIQSNNEWLFTAGAVFDSVPLALYGHLLVAFPTGRLHSRPAKLVVTASYANALAAQLAALVLIPQLCLGCPPNALAIVANPVAGRMLVRGQQITGLALISASLVILAARWARASTAQRRVLAPVLWTAPGLYLATLARLLASLRSPQLYSSSFVILGWIFTLAATTSALGCLIGLLRSSLDRAGIAELIVRLSRNARPGQLRQALARALHDPSLSMLYWIPEQQRFVDPDGRPAVLPDPAEHDRVATLVERDGTRIAALVHDAVVREDPELLDAVCAAAGFALDNERLQAELRARLEELAASRARLVNAADAERRRIERNLHDGAQQRLVAVSMSLGLAAAKLLNNPAAAGALLEEARATLNTALQELRELSRGIHPSALTDHGLATALQELAWTTPLPIQVRCGTTGRLPEPVETTAYYVIAEALTNIVKHAQASSVRITVDHHDGYLIVSVADDGRGGADPARGTGLTGLADRLHTLEGSLQVTSPSGQGTTLTARLPCAW
jgi:signal transduction histidine kinase